MAKTCFWTELWRMLRDQELSPSCRVPSHSEHCEGCRCNEKPWIPLLDTADITTPNWLKDIKVWHTTT